MNFKIDPEKRKRYLLVAALVIAFITPLILGANMYILTVLILMLIFIIFSSAWNFLTYTGQGSLGHAAFFGLGGYGSAMIAVATGISPYITIFLGSGLAALVGLFIGVICVRLKEWFLAMVTFGFAIIIQALMVSQFSEWTGGWDGIAAPRLLSSSIPNYLLIEYYSILLITIVIIILFYYILRSRIGLAFAAIRENELEARAAGINPVKYRLFAFMVSAYFAGVAGALEIHHIGYITPEIFGVDISFWPVIYSISGGLGTLAGPIIGTIVITVLWDGLQSLGISYARYIIIGVLLILIIIFMPKGLISLPDKIKEWMAKWKNSN
ncbi:MAG TPA: branched-chain amino acid ABC transporter permease [Methanoregulaceae archaeon]|nr:branched-chain amino acid ABC transporter permease [Methanoregulaceae archaeon]